MLRACGTDRPAPAPDRDSCPDLCVIGFKGDSMAPTLSPGAPVLVDTCDTRPTPAGVFVLWDSAGLIVKCVLPVPSTLPPMVQLRPDNPGFGDCLLPLATAVIVGRVIGCLEWM